MSSFVAEKRVANDRIWGHVKSDMSLLATLDAAARKKVEAAFPPGKPHFRIFSGLGLAFCPTVGILRA